MKRIGILTSGGDCGGLNAAVRSIFYRAKEKYNLDVYGILEGTVGLMERPPRYIKLDYGTFSGNLIRQGGTFLGTTNKGNPFKYPMPDGTFKDRTTEIVGGYHELGLDGLIVIGGDGSMKIIKEIADKGNLNIVAIPKTIDNDVGATESSIGFHTAVDVATNALDNLQFTAASHSRTMILEVMGRDAGHIALNAGIAGGADVILIPEINYTIDGIIKKLKQLNSYGIKHSLIVVAEAVKQENGKNSTVKFADGETRLGGIGSYIASKIMNKTNIECRVTTLGHVQRGAPPSTQDRILASAFGVYAVDLLAQKKFDRMVAWNDRKVVDFPIQMGIETYKEVEIDDSLVKTALALGIYIGDIS
ncbi:MAG: ATP-dependent 6-phosphofructokinase [Bacteroidota bacterium]|nr:ATP-dependent 6-phosphofructokinase [Bacteroidota bacterium]MEC7127650.1 ATP-dependent 6-phosphofructokinase [Bacteroidota bacterium]MEC7945468.1 ATP-dependent 6-phosphofructokinase [Bacteroidota bacterium]MEC8004423.1 ATP-dependent 6-phosphofructokinase [Bacteroidota bacterium]MEC8030548.1 ATP-dependent 6-phosphofructokinase [Bacteroidota bacterium]|tara:strand:+ start:852 stop:1934 length:1083 start_codon:yes stop_codon:yes gene_type:complete